jgi:hypothetical protein
MSDAGHEVCIFITIGDCALTAGAASAPAVAVAASAPPLRNFLRFTLFTAILFPPNGVFIVPDSSNWQKLFTI